MSGRIYSRRHAQLEERIRLAGDPTDRVVDEYDQGDVGVAYRCGCRYTRVWADWVKPGPGGEDVKHCHKHK